jgi:pimeloyl-ACP methyl ester carboxylesterase
MRQMFDEGSGPVVIVVQPLQGRWQWMRRFLQALAGSCRVISYTLCGDFGSGCRFDPAAGLDQYVRQLEAIVERAGVDRVALCGISFGGTVAVRYAARHPERVTHLVIASSPGPGWQANGEQARYVSRPLLLFPIFLWTAFWRLRRELDASFPTVSSRAAFVARATAAALRYPAWPPLMAARVRLMQEADITSDCARVTAPTLVISGEDALDRVVPPESTRRYLTHIPNNRYEMMKGTGHSGSLTRPGHLARIVGTFVHATNS